MPQPRSSNHTDSHLIQIVDAALASTAQRSGDWLVCKPGCTQCCVGVFAISQLDVARLQSGMADLTLHDPARALRVKERVANSVSRLSADYPGDPLTGILDESDEAEELFCSFANDEVCPVLSPETGTCDLYASRPMTCRVFGPPVRSERGLGVCELCYHGATPEQIAACEMVPDPEDIESDLLDQVERQTGTSGQTIVAFAFTR